MLSRTAKYALKAVAVLGTGNPKSFIQVRELAKKSGVPKPYLAKIIRLLAQEALLETKKGVAGGVRLSTRRHGISFWDVCRALEEPLLSQGCFLSQSPCNPETPCPIHSHWKRIKEQLIGFLKNSKFRENGG